MRLIARMLQALERFTTPQTSAAPTETEILYVAEACSAINDAAPAVSPDKPSSQVKNEQQVTIHLAYAGEDAKYLRVKVAGKTYKVAKSRIQYVRHGDDVMVTMTHKYAASRPELVGQQ
ncbi:MAG: hypothetical protein PHG89_06695 [Gallionella sp.]|nr:hypothetical protein [Gallionella sp.]